MPTENFQACNKESDTGTGQDEGWNGDLGKSCAFNKYAADTVSQHREWKFLDDGGTPFRKIMVAEKDAGKYHHRHGDKVDEPVPDLGFCRMG